MESERKPRKRLWSFSASAPGMTVRIYEARKDKNLMRELRVRGHAPQIKCIGHKDRDRAMTDANELLREIAKQGALLDKGDLSISQLYALYICSSAHTNIKKKKIRTQREDEAKLRRLVRFFGPDKHVLRIGPDDVRSYEEARSEGLVTDDNKKYLAPTRDRAIQADLSALRAAMNWACLEKLRPQDESSPRLLAFNPLQGVKLPYEKNLLQPLMSDDTYRRVLEVAPRVHELLPLAIEIASGTGRRLSAIRQLSWTDVDYVNGKIWWRADFDKMRDERSVDVYPAELELLRLAQLKSVSTWVFPSPKNSTKACDRFIMDGWLRRAFVLAGVQKQKGELWHSLRRKWATTRKHESLKDVAFAGGWRDVSTLLRYQQPDAATIKAIMYVGRDKIAPS